MPRMTVRVLAFMFLALAIGQAEAQRRLLASQKNYSTANIQNLQNYYGTGSSNTANLQEDPVVTLFKRLQNSFYPGNQDCPGAEGTHYPGTVAFQGADPDRYQSSLNYVQTGVLSARECHERGHAMAVASKLGVHANDLTNINTLQIPQATLLPTSTSVYYGVIENGRCEMHTLAPNGGDFTVGSPFLGWSTCVHA